MNANYSAAGRGLAVKSARHAAQLWPQRARARWARELGSMPNLAARGAAPRRLPAQPEPAELAVPHPGVPAVRGGRRHTGGAQPGERPGRPLQRQGAVQDLQLLHGRGLFPGELARRRPRKLRAA